MLKWIFLNTTMGWGREVFILVILLRIKFPNIFQGEFWVNEHKGDRAENARTRQ